MTMTVFLCGRRHWDSHWRPVGAKEEEEDFDFDFPP